MNAAYFWGTQAAFGTASSFAHLRYCTNNLSYCTNNSAKYNEIAGSEACPLYAHILGAGKKETQTKLDTVGESARNRFGRPYISGRPLLTCDRRRIVELYEKGMKKIRIAQQLGITHSCVSKVIRRFKETGILEAKNSRTASCACPGEAAQHDVQICRHMRYTNFYWQQKKSTPFTIDWILSDECCSKVNRRTGTDSRHIVGNCYNR